MSTQDGAAESTQHADNPFPAKSSQTSHLIPDRLTHHQHADSLPARRRIQRRPTAHPQNPTRHLLAALGAPHSDCAGGITARDEVLAVIAQRNLQIEGAMGKTACSGPTQPLKPLMLQLTHKQLRRPHVHTPAHERARTCMRTSNQRAHTHALEYDQPSTRARVCARR